VEMGHGLWVFTVPKMLRPYFLRHRELLGDLCRAAWDTVREMLAAGAAEEIRPGMVAVVQTFGQRVNFHPHVHAIASRGGWRKDGTWVPVAYEDSGAAEKVLRHHVFDAVIAATSAGSSFGIGSSASAVRCSGTP
jgi:diadenosine tetraphosphate (Ap4A) HIT family hydrolase